MGNDMTQEVRVMLQLTLEVAAGLSKEEIEKRLKQNFIYCKDPFCPDEDIDVEMVDVIEIREEAEIYGNE